MELSLYLTIWSNGLTGPHYVLICTLCHQWWIWSAGLVEWLIACRISIFSLKAQIESLLFSFFSLLCFNLLSPIKWALSWLLKVLSVLTSFPLGTSQNTLLTVSPCVGCRCFWKAPLILLLKKRCWCHDNYTRWMSELNGHCSPSCLFEQPPRRRF